MAIIGIDATSISVAGKGVSCYQHNLIKALAVLDRQNSYYVFLDKRNILPELPRQSNFNYIRIRLLNHIIWDQFQLPGILRKYNPDIYHTTSDTLPVLGKTKTVLYIFEIPDYRVDLMSTCPGNSLYSRISRGYDKAIFPRGLRKAVVIMTSSKSTEADLIKKYAVQEDKIKVVYPGISDCFRASADDTALIDTRRKYNSAGGYILHISSSDPRDNTPTVIRAFKKASQEAEIPQKL
ncbi:MAG: glycosyltransferase, partial [Thermodesulfobacteriota bacterium]